MMAFKLASSFGRSPAASSLEVLLKGRQQGTPEWTARHPPYAHGAHTGNSHLVQMDIHTLKLVLMHMQHTRALRMYT